MLKLIHAACTEDDLEPVVIEHKYEKTDPKVTHTFYWPNQRPLNLNFHREEGAPAPTGFGHMVEMTNFAQQADVIIPDTWETWYLTEIASRERKVLLAVHDTYRSPEYIREIHGTYPNLAHFITIIRARR